MFSICGGWFAQAMRQSQKLLQGRVFDSPSLVGSFPVQFGLAFFAVVVFGGGVAVGDSYAEAMLPDFALIALDEEPIRVGLVIVAALVLLVAADAARNLVLGLTGVVHLFVGDRVGGGVGGVFVCSVVEISFTTTLLKGRVNVSV